MRDKLHDKIDGREAILEAVANAIAKIKREDVERILSSVSGDSSAVFEEIARLVEDELADITTKAVRQGFESMREVQKHTRRIR